MSIEGADRCILITGCSTGIGRLTALKLLKDGWHVIATMRDAEKRQADFIAEAGEHSKRLDILSLDVTNQNDRESVAEFTSTHKKPLYGLINNAGYGLFGALEDQSEKQITDQMQVNFFSVVSLTRILLPQLRKNQGRIINVTSVLGYTGMPLTSMYCASKFALEGLSESLYYELKPFGVQVALVEPGGHRTEFGKNVVWAENALDQKSPYRSFTQSYQAFSAKLSSGKGVSPENVANAISSLLQRTRMPLRTRCGYDALGMFLLKKLTPQIVENGLLQVFYKRAILK